MTFSSASWKASAGSKMRGEKSPLFLVILSIDILGGPRTDGAGRISIIPQPPAFCQEKRSTKIKKYFFPILCILTIEIRGGWCYTIIVPRGKPLESLEKNFKKVEKKA